MECMSEKSDGAYFTDPFQTIEVTQRQTAFVDDTTNWQNNFRHDLLFPSNIAKMLALMAIAAQWWEALLHALGGKLELLKCFFYITSWEFDQEGVASVRMMDPDDNVTIIDSESGNEVYIRQECSTASHKTLGATENPSGNYKDEIKRLDEKATKFAQYACCAVLSREEANVLYSTMYVPSISYSFPAGTMTLAQAKKIQGKVSQAFLPAMGYCRTTPLAVVYGPIELGGIGMRHLFTEQGSLKVQMIMQQIRVQRPLGKLLLIYFQWAQQISGLEESIIIVSKTRIPQLKNETWLTTLREYLRESELGIEIPDILVPKLHREGDRTIMNQCQHISNSDITKVNRCRMFLRVQTVAEITNSSGNELKRGIAECLPNSVIESDQLWPRQPRPGPKHRAIWKKFVQSLCVSGGETTKTLGKWSGAPWRQKCEGFYDPHLNIMVTSHGRSNWIQWTIGEATRRGTRLLDPIRALAGWNTEEGIPADISENGRGEVIANWGKEPLSLGENEHNAKTWEEFVATLQPWEQGLVRHYDEVGSTKLWQALGDPEEKLIAVSDGGNIDTRGSYGWVIGNDNEVICQSKGIARGTPMSSYRAEGYGKLSWLCFLCRYCEFFDIDIKCSIDQYCVNDALIKKTNEKATKQTVASLALASDYDIVKQIATVQDFARTISKEIGYGSHVKAHKDRTTPYHKLSRPEQLNLEADKLATIALIDAMNLKEDPPTIPFPACKAYLISGTTRVTSKELNLLRWKWSEFKLQDYLSKRL